MRKLCNKKTKKEQSFKVAGPRSIKYRSILTLFCPLKDVRIHYALSHYNDQIIYIQILSDNAVDSAHARMCNEH